MVGNAFRPASIRARSARTASRSGFVAASCTTYPEKSSVARRGNVDPATSTSVSAAFTKPGEVREVVFGLLPPVPQDCACLLARGEFDIRAIGKVLGQEVLRAKDVVVLGD